jgi:hypothetical protein
VSGSVSGIDLSRGGMLKSVELLPLTREKWAAKLSSPGTQLPELSKLLTLGGMASVIGAPSIQLSWHPDVRSPTLPAAANLARRLAASPS